MLSEVMDCYFESTSINIESIATNFIITIIVCIPQNSIRVTRADNLMKSQSIKSKKSVVKSDTSVPHHFI